MAIDRSATAISRATRRNAAHIAAGKALEPGGALYLFYGYGARPGPGTAGENASRILQPLTGHLTGGGFAVEDRRGAGVVGVVATPRGWEVER